MQKLTKILRSDLFLLFFNAAIIHTAFVAVVLSIYQGAPEVLADSSLREIIEVFEG